MKMKLQTKVNLFWIALGMFYAFAPHSTHVQFNVDFGLNHVAHQLIGWGLIIFGFFNQKIKKR